MKKRITDWQEWLNAEYPRGNKQNLINISYLVVSIKKKMRGSPDDEYKINFDRNYLIISGKINEDILVLPREMVDNFLNFLGETYLK